VIERREAHPFHVLIITCIPEIMPQSQGNGGKLQAAPAAAVILHFLITMSRRVMHVLSSFSIAAGIELLMH
jgi:hypothetical protein